MAILVFYLRHVESEVSNPGSSALLFLLLFCSSSAVLSIRTVRDAIPLLSVAGPGCPQCKVQTCCWSIRNVSAGDETRQAYCTLLLLLHPQSWLLKRQNPCYRSPPPSSHEADISQFNEEVYRAHSHCFRASDDSDNDWVISYACVYSYFSLSGLCSTSLSIEGHWRSRFHPTGGNVLLLRCLKNMSMRAKLKSDIFLVWQIWIWRWSTCV